jgi:phthalate 4,5-cis-dihydrodiol dehydrogenase
MVSDTIFLGVAGLGRAFTLMVPTLTRDPRVRLTAAADPRAEARRCFERDFGGKAYETVEALCADPAINAVYVATPHELHAPHVITAARAGKHVLVEKPIATTLADAKKMVSEANILVVGHSHSFDAPVARARAIVASGAVGRVRMITAINFTDFLYRPRRADDLDSARGGGALLSQAAHQVDIARMLAGGMATSVRCMAGTWDEARRTEGAYAALIAFAGGAFASLAYSGYAHFDSDELCEWVGELGRDKDPAAYGAARAALARAGAAEADARAARNYGGADYREAPAAHHHEHFGPLVVSCERADLRPTPKGVWIYGDDERRFEPLPPPAVARAEVIDELHGAMFAGRAPSHDGRWGLATLEVCLAMRESARTGREVPLSHQVAMG